MNTKGYTYIEMLTSLVISSFVVLSIGAVSGISRQSYNKTVVEADVFADISYGYKLLQNRIRSASSFSVQTPGTPWVSQQLVINNKEAFGLYQAAGSSTIDFVYMKDKNVPANREVLFRVSTNDAVSLIFTPNGKSVMVQLAGTKQKVPFNFSTTALRRIG